MIKRRSANHSWRPSSKAAPKKIGSSIDALFVHKSALPSGKMPFHLQEILCLRISAALSSSHLTIIPALGFSDATVIDSAVLCFYLQNSQIYKSNFQALCRSCALQMTKLLFLELVINSIFLGGNGSVYQDCAVE